MRGWVDILGVWGGILAVVYDRIDEILREDDGLDLPL